MKVMVTGGAGYIGSHAVLELLRERHQVAVIDNFSNSSPISLKKIEQLSGQSVPLFEINAANSQAVEQALHSWPAEAIMHFAGHKAVGESGEKPLEYYENNLLATIAVGKAVVKTGVKRIVFSSTATVYGEPEKNPVNETAPLHPQSPYAWTKLMCEQILTDLQVAHPKLSIIILRYFNPIGADASGEIGEDPSGIPNNLLPFIAQLSVGRRKVLQIYGNDYPTPDGTGIRDYLHVSDLAEGHVAALEKAPPGVSIYNLGTGHGKSVFEVLHAFEAACGKKLPFVIKPRRAGDVAEYYADPGKAKRELGWRATRNLDDMCRDIWRWQSKHPNGLR